MIRIVLFGRYVQIHICIPPAGSASSTIIMPDLTITFIGTLFAVTPACAQVAGSAMSLKSSRAAGDPRVAVGMPEVRRVSP